MFLCIAVSTPRGEQMDHPSKKADGTDPRKPRYNKPDNAYEYPDTHRHYLAYYNGVFVDRFRRLSWMGGPSARRVVCLQLCKGTSRQDLTYLQHTILLFARCP